MAHSRKVLLDSQIFCTQTVGGVSRYFSEILAHDSTFARAGFDLCTPYRWVLSDSARAARPSFRVPQFGPARNHRVLLSSSFVPQKLRTYDIVHHTYYHPRFHKAFRSGRVVSTLYDMIPEKFSQQFPHGNPHQSKDLYVRSSDALICISESTRNDVSEHYGIPVDRMRVIPLAPASVFFEQEPKASPYSFPYFLYVGVRGGYKNFSALLGAVAKSRELREVRIVAAGGGPLSSQEQRDIATLGLSGRVLHASPDDTHLRRLYAHALAYVCPSLYEGFGIPVLEAMASGCPVVASNLSSLPEVAGSAGVLVDVSDTASFRHSLEQIAFDTSLANHCRSLGRVHAEGFSWARTAKLTSEVYAEI